MVKGISRQVIVVQSQEPDIFEQAIFILKDGRQNVTDEALLKEAKRLINMPSGHKKARRLFSGAVWACAGAFVTAVIWLITSIV